MDATALVIIALGSNLGKPRRNIGLTVSVVAPNDERAIVLEEGKFLAIENGGRHDYTDEYKTLTRDFYLNF